MRKRRHKKREKREQRDEEAAFILGIGERQKTFVEQKQKVGILVFLWTFYTIINKEVLNDNEQSSHFEVELDVFIRLLYFTVLEQLFTVSEHDQRNVY